MKKVLSVLFVLAFVVTVFAACGRKEGASPGGTSAASPGESNPYTKPWSVASIYSEITGEFWGVVYNGYKKAEAELAAYGIKSYCLAPASGTDYNLQMELIDAALEKGADGIVLSPMDADVIGAYVTDTFTKDYGCPIVAIDRPINSDHSLNTDSEWVVARVMSDIYKMGQEAGRLAEEAMGGEGLYIMLGIKPSSRSWGNEWGALDYLEDNVPGMEMAADIFWKSQNTEEQCVAFVQDQCSRYPNEPLAFLVAGDEAARNVVSALSEIAECGMQRPAGDVVVAWDFFSTDLTSIVDGKLYGVVAHNPFLLGYNAVYTLIDYLEGAETPYFIPVPYCIITKNNLESREVKEYLASMNLSL